jgi:hypothetical protein
MSDDIAEQFELLQSKVEGLYEETVALSKKNPQDAFNKFKLRLTNNILLATNAFLKEHGAVLPVDGFVEFEDDQMPTNSDVVFVLSQYLQCLEQWRAARIALDMGVWYWKIEGVRSTRTAPPRKLK